MGKRKDDDSDEDAKKKKKDAKKKKKDKKPKKDKKKKKKEAKKGKKQDTGSSSSASSSCSSGAAAEQKDAKKRKKDAGEDGAPQASLSLPPNLPLNLPSPEEGILRFEYSVEEVGPLGLRFSGGFPPLILAVNPDSFASKKGIPANHEVHAINGHPLVPQNRDVVMASLKQRPLALDVRPQGWKPLEKAKEIERKRAREEAEKLARIQVEEQRREQVAREAAEQAAQEAAERAERRAHERREQEVLEKRAREVLGQQKAKEEEFEQALAAEPVLLRKAAEDIMKADYGADINLEGLGRRGLPLRMMTRRREVAWLWAGEVQELIGGGAPDLGDTWT